MGGGKVYLKSLAAVSAADEQIQNNGHSSQFAPTALCRMGSGSNYDGCEYRDVCDYVKKLIIRLCNPFSVELALWPKS